MLALALSSTLATHTPVYLQHYHPVSLSPSEPRTLWQGRWGGALPRAAASLPLTLSPSLPLSLFLTRDTRIPHCLPRRGAGRGLLPPVALSHTHCDHVAL